MRIVEPDFARMIDLPGVSPCPRPVDIDQSVTGFSNLRSLRVYTFACDKIIDGEAEEDELFIVLLSGTVDVLVAGASTASFTLQTGSGTGAVYLPPHDSYRLRVRSDADVAYARAQPGNNDSKMARAFDYVDGRLAVIDYSDSFSIALSAQGVGNDRFLSTLGSSAAERLIHIRCNDSEAICVAGQSLHNWQTLALDRGDPGEIGPAGDSTTVFIVAAA